MTQSDNLKELDTTRLSEGDLLDLVVLYQKIEDNAKKLILGQRIPLDKVFKSVSNDTLHYEDIVTATGVTLGVKRGIVIGDGDLSEAREALEELDNILESRNKNLAGKTLLSLRLFFLYGSGRLLINLSFLLFTFLLFGVQYLAHFDSGRRVVAGIINLSDLIRDGILIFMLIASLVVFSVIATLFYFEKRTTKNHTSKE